MKKLSEIDKKKTKGNQNKKLSPIADILLNKHFYDKLLRVAVGKGESVLEVGAEDGK